jgi:23S rRNA (cytidine1920-2'-O)/16S rRNA (cytidine1409-2'-O)-methyltransferase
LRAALSTFEVVVQGRTCLDLGAAAGGFTRVLLEAGAARVYAVDVGHGQLLGSLRQDPRVINLEATNVSALDTSVIPDPIDVVTIDVSYLALAAAVAQLDRISIAPDAELIGLVKPMFELRLGTAPTDAESVAAATDRAAEGIESCGWHVLGTMPSPVLGGRGAVEALLHARRSR